MRYSPINLGETDDLRKIIKEKKKIVDFKINRNP